MDGCACDRFMFFYTWESALTVLQKLKKLFHDHIFENRFQIFFSLIYIYPLCKGVSKSSGNQFCSSLSNLEVQFNGKLQENTYFDKK